MRVITWNCNRSFSKKAQHILDLAPDVAILQECEKGYVAPAGYRYLWTGLNDTMGLGVLTRDLLASPEPRAHESWTFFLPVTMPTLGIRVLGVWAFHHRAAKLGSGRDGNINSVLDELSPWLAEGRSLMAGDFNHNLKWDTLRGKNNFRPIVHRLRQLGLRSAYHEATLEGFNTESQPTHLFRRNEQAKYHIDYCFLHHSLPFTAVEVLRSAVWQGLSDHLPIVIDVR